MDLHGATLLVTGGSSGLGAACVRMLVAAGARAVIADLNATAGAALVRELGAAVRFIQTDVTDPASVQGAVEAAAGEFGPLRGAINCAGIAIGQRVVGRNGPHDLDSFRRVLEINLLGTFNVVRLAAAAIAHTPPCTPDGERGVLVLTASVAAFDGQIGQAAYSASKGGVAAMTLPIARELAGLGIRVVTIAPGIFETPMMAGMPEATRRSLGEQVPFPSRLGQPTEFAALVRQVLENSMLNGEVIRLDGAIRMTPR